MNTEALFIFLILLLGLILCSFLGGSREGFSGKTPETDDSVYSSSGASTAYRGRYDHYNHYTGASSQLSSGTTFYGQHGKTATVVSNVDGSQSLQIVLPNASTPVTFNTSPTVETVETYTNYDGVNGSATMYYGPNGASATVVNADNGQQAIKVTTSSGTYYYNTSGAQSTDSTTQYYGSTGSVTGPNGTTAYYAEGPAGNVAVGTTSDPYNGGSVTGPQGNTAYYAQGPQGNAVVGTTSQTYYDTMPAGIPRSQIPSGQEDLYILKSQVVPPVCPACPVSTSIPRQEPCPACPACARCPEPSFECKKVPNYNAINSDYLPAPVLSDFSQFGM